MIFRLMNALLAAAMVLTIGTAEAQAPINPNLATAAPYSVTPLGFQQISVTTAVPLPSLPTNATCAVINVEGNAIRWRDDGTAPTTSVGQPTAVGQPLTLCMTAAGLAAVQIISQAGTATVDVSYYH